MRKLQDLTGQKFGRLLVLALHAKATGKATKWTCQCDCGALTITGADRLKDGTAKSCGCWAREVASLLHSKHRMWATGLWYSWKGMRQRCSNPNNRAFRNYGGRGIKVCQEWQDFQAFQRDMGSTWAKGLTLERVNVNGDYTAANCIWVAPSEQPKNRRPSSQWKKPPPRKRDAKGRILSALSIAPGGV